MLCCPYNVLDVEGKWREGRYSGRVTPVSVYLLLKLGDRCRRSEQVSMVGSAKGLELM